MDRDKLIDAAQAALHRHCNGFVSFDHDPGAHRGDAQAVLDAILPQVTTVEELEALPHGTWLISAGGKIITRYHGPLGPTQASVALLPLTAVWRP